MKPNWKQWVFICLRRKSAVGGMVGKPSPVSVRIVWHTLVNVTCPCPLSHNQLTWTACLRTLPCAHMKVNCHVSLSLVSIHNTYTLHLLLFPALHPINKLRAKRIQLHNIPERETNYLRVLHHPQGTSMRVNTKRVCPALPNPVILNQDIYIA